VNNHEAVRRDLPGFVVDALDENRRSEIDRHLAECPDCTRQLESLRAIERLASMTPPDAEPPKRLADHVLALVEGEPAAAVAHKAAIGPEPPPDLERRSLARAGIFPGRDRPWPARVATALAPALAAAAVVLSFMYADARNDLDIAQEAGASPTPGAIVEQIVGLPVGHPMQRVELFGQSADADMRLVHFRHDNYRLELHAADLPELVPDHYYEVWLAGKDGIISAGSFRILWPDELMFNFNVGIDPAEYHHIEITQEPVDGTPYQEGPVVVRGDFDPAHVAHD
jgi:hypothetical protein